MDDEGLTRRAAGTAILPEVEPMNFVLQAFMQSLFGALAAFFSSILAAILGLPTTGTGA